MRRAFFPGVGVHGNKARRGFSAALTCFKVAGREGLDFQVSGLRLVRRSGFGLHDENQFQMLPM